MRDPADAEGPWRERTEVLPVNRRTLIAMMAVGFILVGTLTVSAKDPSVVAQVGTGKGGPIYYILSDGSVWEETYICPGLQLHDTTIMETGKFCPKDKQVGL
jgi:hypothetical protein